AWLDRLVNHGLGVAQGSRRLRGAQRAGMGSVSNWVAVMTEPLSSKTSPHTPGPWKAAPKGDGWHITAEAPKGLYGLYTFVATVHGMRGNDAKLIAAAPNLLALAHQYADECGDC